MKPESFARAHVSISPPCEEQKGKELRLGDKLKNTTVVVQHQEFKATKSAPHQALEFTVKKPTPKVQEPGQANKLSELEQFQKISDVKTDTKDITFKVSIEHSDAGEMQLQSVSVSLESSEIKTVPQIIEMSPQNSIHVQSQLVDLASSDSHEPAPESCEDKNLCTSPQQSSEDKQLCTSPQESSEDKHLCNSPQESSEHKHLCISPQDSSEHKHLCTSSQESSEDKHLCTSSQKSSPDGTSLKSSKDSKCITTSAECFNSTLPSAHSIGSSQCSDTSQENTFPNVDPKFLMRKLSKPVDIASTNRDKDSPLLISFRKINSSQLADLEIQLNETTSQAQSKKVHFAEPEKKNPEEEKVISYKCVVVGGQVQKILDDDASEVSSVVRRPKTTKKVDRRISCKDLGKCECQGWLLKHKEKNVGPLSRSWMKRWCVLKNSNFFFYRNKADLKAEGVIHLPAFQVSPAPEVKSKKKIVFKVHNSGTSFYFASERQDDMSKWMNKMGLSAITYSDEAPATTSRIQKPESGTQKAQNDYYSESENEDDNSSPEKLSLSPASMRAESPSFKRPKTRSPDLGSPASVHSNRSTESTDDLVVLYRNIKKENLTMMGKDRRTAMSTDMDKLESHEQMNKTLKLKSLQRTLKAKEQELLEIQHLLSSKITHSKLADFTECHAILGTPHSSQYLQN